MAEHGAALAINAVNRMGVQVDNIDIQVERELFCLRSGANGVVRGFFYRFATGRKRPEADSQLGVVASREHSLVRVIC